MCLTKVKARDMILVYGIRKIPNLTKERTMKQKDSSGNEYVQVNDYLRVTRVGNDFRISTVTEKGTVCKGPQISYDGMNDLLKGVYFLF